MTLSGKVVKNLAVRNAVVCLDLNANSLCDAMEPFARSGADGAYSLSYETAAVTPAQAASASLIANIVPGPATDANTTIDAAAPDSSMTTAAYVLRQVPGRAGQINPLTTLVAAGIAGGMNAATARANVAAQLAISDAKIDDYQDDPAFDTTAAPDTARTAAYFVGDALEKGVKLVVSDQLGATSAAPGALVTLNFTNTANYYVRTNDLVAKDAGVTGSLFRDNRSGASAGTALGVPSLYPVAYLTGTGWKRCDGATVHPSTRGTPSRSVYCDVAVSLGHSVDTPIAGQGMASVVTALQTSGVANPINNGISNTELLAALGSATFAADSASQRRVGLALSQPVFISNLSTDARPQSEATTLEQLISAKPASSVNLATSAGTLSLGVSSSAQRNLRVAFTGVTSATAGTVQFYDCELNAAGTAASNCSATQTGTYTIETANGVRLMRFAGYGATPASTQVNLYAELSDAAGVTGRWVYRARQSKPGLDANLSTAVRLNAAAWASMRAQLGI